MAIQSIEIITDADGEEAIIITEDNRSPYTIKTQNLLQRHANVMEELKQSIRTRDEILLDGGNVNDINNILQTIRPKALRLKNIVDLYQAAKITP